MPEWKDTTSYSRDKERKPTCWTADYGDNLRITVTCGHVRYRGTWVMHCHSLRIDTKPIDAADSLDDAKTMAEAYVRSTLLGYLQAIGE